LLLAVVVLGWCAVLCFEFALRKKQINPEQNPRLEYDWLPRKEVWEKKTVEKRR